MNTSHLSKTGSTHADARGEPLPIQIPGPADCAPDSPADVTEIDAIGRRIYYTALAHVLTGFSVGPGHLDKTLTEDGEPAEFIQSVDSDQRRSDGRERASVGAGMGLAE
jgi:hypothetical protein